MPVQGATIGNPKTLRGLASFRIEQRGQELILAAQTLDSVIAWVGAFEANGARSSFIAPTLSLLPPHGGQEVGTDGEVARVTLPARGADVVDRLPSISATIAPLLEIHYKARSQDNPLYPTRQKVDDSLTSWGADYPDYSPEEWTADVVLANDRDLSTGEGWADPPDVKRAGLDQRVSYAANGQATAVLLDGDGMPRNPAGRTGLRGRGLLGKWGPNQAADPIVTRYDPQTQKLQMVAIRRKDTGEWAIPGGMVDDGEVVSATLRREFEEEACNIEGDEAREQVTRPPSNTDIGTKHTQPH